MNNPYSSESSSGSESGWTLYLDQSFLSPFPSNETNGRGNYRGENRAPKDEDEEEDSSMVSDASSGPQILYEDEFYGNTDNGFLSHATIDVTLVKNSERMMKNRVNRRLEVEEDDPSFLDDTASSPLFNFSKRNFTHTNNQASMEGILDFSQGRSATHVEGSSEFHEPFGFFPSSLSGNQLQENQWFGGKKGMR